MNTLQFPSFERFILENGEKYLTNKFFNGDLATYTFFAAITNQFLNCRLNEVFNDNKIDIEDGNITATAFQIYSDFAFPTLFGNPDDELDEALHHYFSEYRMIKDILIFLENKEIYINEEKGSVSLKRDLKRAILYLVIVHGSNDGFDGLHRISPIELGKTLSKMYFQSCVKFSNIQLFKIGNHYYTKTEFNNDYELDDNTAFKVSHYKKWKEYIDLMEQSIKTHKKTMILSKEPCQKFKAKFKKDKMQIELEKILLLDLILNEEIIPFKDTFNNTIDAKKVENFYTLLFNSFFTKGKVDAQIEVLGTRIRFYKDVKRKNIESNKINLLYERIPEAIL